MKPKFLLFTFLTVFGLFSKTTNSQTFIYGYSDVFEIGGPVYEAPKIIGYSEVFDMNTMGNYIYGNSDLFLLNSIGGQMVVDFTADQTQVNPGEPIHFNDLTAGASPPIAWLWDFGDGSPLQYEKNPVHAYSGSGIYNVKLTVTNAAGLQYPLTKQNFVTVNTEADGIQLQVLKTNQNAGPEIIYAGYNYTVKKKNWLGVWKDYQWEAKFPVVNNIVTINSFPTETQLPSGYKLKDDFNNEIVLFDENEKQIGHIFFEYEPEKEKDHIRNAFLLFHNDNEILADNYYPYGPEKPGYDKKWKYYTDGEYPVSMLIPPHNDFQSISGKDPLLMIHGWEGRYKIISNPDAKAEKNETSYWFTTVEKLNEAGTDYDAWQYYYPYNSAHKHSAICLKYGLVYLKDIYSTHKIGLVTHSMGGLITMRYLTQFSDDAQEKISKALFMAPPAHGSLGANLFYKTDASPLLEFLIGYDRNAPAVKDMKLGSDATWFIHTHDLPNLDNKDGLADDYFVLLGSTYKFYMSDTYVQSNGVLSHSAIHSEASNHHDGIVAISSGSLLDKGVGFATFLGNHNDAVHMQSFKRNDPDNQNIGDENLLPEIIEKYFSHSNEDFIDYLKTVNDITAIVNDIGEVVKPADQILKNLNTNNGVNYQKGIINIDFPDSRAIKTYWAYYNNNKKSLILKAEKKSWFGQKYKGVFRANTSSNDSKRYFFNDYDPLLAKNYPNQKSLIYDGCGIELEQGTNKIIVKNWLGFNAVKQSFDFGYCRTNNILIEESKSFLENSGDNYTDTKEKYIMPTGTVDPDSLFAIIHIDDETDLVNFNLSSLDAAIYQFTGVFKMKLPDGTLADSTFQSGAFQHDADLGNISMEIPNPMPGKWCVWIESDYPGADTMSYNAMAFVQSDVFAWLPDTIDEVASNASCELKTALKVDDFDVTDSLQVHATIYRPDLQEDVFDITTSAYTQDSSFYFKFEYDFPQAGEYIIKYNVDGIYNGFAFERCLHQFVVANDTVAILNIPDVTLRQQKPDFDIDLEQYLFNVDNFDTLYFTSEIISTNLDSLAFNATMDSLSLTSYLSTDLSASGEATVKYTCLYDENQVSDTVTVAVLLPDLRFDTVSISNTNMSNNSSIAIDYAINNDGNFDAPSYAVGYYLTKDELLGQDDYYLGFSDVLLQPVDSLLTMSDSIHIPTLDISGEYFWAAVIDPVNAIAEANESNNLCFIPVTLNEPPLPPDVISAEPDYGSVHLTWSANNQKGISGYVVYYGVNPNGNLSKKYVLSADTTTTVSGLSGGTIYHFAVSAYRIFGVESDLSGFASAIPIAPLVQQLNLAAGWSGISSYTLPFESDVELLFDPILTDLIILQNETGMYWPGQNVNTLGAWNTHMGYQVKVADTVALTITGAKENNKTLQLAAGWNLIPVISECDVDVVALFDGVDVIIVKEVAGWNVYWPEFGINSLPVLTPGKAYFVLMNEAAEITFPECNGTKSSGFNVQPQVMPEGFDVTRTAFTHTIAIPAQALAQFETLPGFIGAFDEQGNCFGIAKYENQFSITLYGNDPLTAEKDGFTEGEFVRLKWITTNDSYDISVEYDQNLPVSDGNFAINGLSAVKSLNVFSKDKMSDKGNGIIIYPNPANESVFINLPGSKAAMLSIYDMHGRSMITGKLKQGKSEVNLSDLKPGIYLLKIENDTLIKVERLIKK